MANLTLQEVEVIAGRGRPWTFRMEQTGEYWFATGRGLQEAVEVGYGFMGSLPHLQLVSWGDLTASVTEKISQGWQYANTPYIRMSPGNLAAATGNPIVKAQTAKAVSSLQATAKSPLSVTPPQVTQAQQTLAYPYSAIRALKLVRSGTTVTGYSALDAQGQEMLVLTPPEAISFAQKYSIDVLFF